MIIAAAAFSKLDEYIVLGTEPRAATLIEPATRRDTVFMAEPAPMKNAERERHKTP